MSIEESNIFVELSFHRLKGFPMMTLVNGFAGYKVLLKVKIISLFATLF